MKWVIAILGLVLIMGFFIGCKKETVNGYKVYKIKEGQHRSSVCIKTLAHHTLMFEAIFDGSAVYTTSDPVNQHDINKLYGFSECNQRHHKNSARFGWRWLNGNLEIHAYVYNDGERSSQFITNVSLNKSYKYSIEMYDDYYVFRVDNESIKMTRTNNCDTGLFYMLFPYFGGDEKAPHEIKIQIREDRRR